LEPDITLQQPVVLRGFCERVVAKYSANWPPTEETIAREFVSFAQPDGLDLGSLEGLCARFGISVLVRRLPEGIRGYNHLFGQKRQILIAQSQSTGTVFGIQEHTLFHELRELIEYEFREIGSSVALSDLESRAESFASTVRLEASMMVWKPLLDDVTEMKSGWGRIVLGLLLVFFVAVQAFSCVMLPRWEDQLERRGASKTRS